ncbi:hypothetical protein [Salinarchaeum sp. Harcht-Bsk1]|uniref:hypothetical protein n=1 Tax=Salinarchaeum sp. Harcht-Bsk1 TaxID=1333523 RepID=UPI00118177EF|nr:hypothetical protein [Salinarchaeum sp. Harcht-Bsk1]
MQGDTIVLTEGINDLAFLEQLHSRSGVGEYCDRFNNQESDETQTQRIRQHRIGTSITYLYKCEGGRSEVEKIYAREGPSIGEKGLRTVLMFDMDDDSSFSDVLDSLNSSLWKEWRNRISLSANRHIDITSDFIIKECTLGGNGEIFDEPIVITFFNDMETATGMSYGAPFSKKKQEAEQYFRDRPNETESLIDALYS